MPRLWTNGVFWFSILALPIFCLSRDFAWKSYKRFAKPEPYHIVQEIQKCVHSAKKAGLRHWADLLSGLTDSTCPTTAPGRRSSRKRSKRSERCNGRGGTVALPSRRPKKAKRRSSGATTPRSRRRRGSRQYTTDQSQRVYICCCHLCKLVRHGRHWELFSSRLASKQLSHIDRNCALQPNMTALARRLSGQGIYTCEADVPRKGALATSPAS